MRDGVGENFDVVDRSGDGARVAVGLPRVASTLLFGAAREIVILHRDQEYRLRITKADKLILTK